MSSCHESYDFELQPPLVGPLPCQFENLGGHNWKLMTNTSTVFPVADSYSGAHNRTLSEIIYMELKVNGGQKQCSAQLKKE
jgi:hypothetical protein